MKKNIIANIEDLNPKDYSKTYAHNVDTSKISIESKSKEYFYRWSRNETVDDKNGTISLTIDKYDFNRIKIAKN